MKNSVKTFEPNLVGKDYVIGDLHGSLSAFKNLLTGIKFNSEVDRMFSVGDLCDRGPDSLGCLSLLHNAWFHAVLSNHEQMMIEKFNGGRSGPYWFQNGGIWGAEAWNDYKAVYRDQRHGYVPSDRSVEVFELLPKIEELPYLITVNLKSGKKYHIIHAELPARTGTVITDELLEDPVKVMELATIQRGDGDAFLWSRNLFDQFYSANLQDRAKIVRTIKHMKATGVFNDKLSHIISGHTILQRPMTIVGQTNIDTGAYDSYWTPVEPYSHGGRAPSAWAALTCIELDAWQFYQATEATFKKVKPFVVTASQIK